MFANDFPEASAEEVACDRWASLLRSDEAEPSIREGFVA